MGRTRYRKINVDFNTIVTILGFIAILVIYKVESKRQKNTFQVELDEKNALYKKEAMITAKEALQGEIDKFQEEVKERRQELSKNEAKL